MTSTGFFSSLSRSALAAGIASGLLFLICWIGTFTKVPATHAFIELFTDLPVASTAALGDGLVWAVLFGALAGFLFVLSYRLVQQTKAGCCG